MTACLLCSAFLACACSHAPPPGPAVGLLADYDNELRGPDGHVDVPLLISQLKALGANSYFFLIWHAPTDWEDLQAFLPAARKAGIDVWAYLCPPSEPPPSAPFGLDFVRWGEELARLSLEFPNLRAWVIDDFYANGDKLGPAHIAQIQRAAHKINPRLAFFPLMYFPEIGSEFMELYAAVIDGVVVAYPTGPRDIVRARKILRTEIVEPSSCAMTFPLNTLSEPGDYVEMSRPVALKPGAPRQTISFRQHDTYGGPTSGYHFKQLLIDGDVVWEQDTGGGDTDWHAVTVDVTARVRGKKTVTVALRCYDKLGVSNYYVAVGFTDLSLRGFAHDALVAGGGAAWRQSSRGKWSVGFHPRTSAVGGFRLPYVVMTAAQDYEYKLRMPGSQGTPAEIAAHLNMALEQMKAGNCDGVVTYCLPKEPGNPYFDAVRSVVAGFLALHH